MKKIFEFIGPFLLAVSILFFLFIMINPSVNPWNWDWWNDIIDIFGHFLPFYLIICAFSGIFAHNRELGYWGGFSVTYLFSPLLGLIMISLSEKDLEIK